MSNNKKVKEQNEQKAMTKYDLKMQRRKEEKAKAKREERISTIIGIVVVVALVCLFAAFPINSYLTTHKTYVTIGGEDVSQLEFDYRYNIVKNNYYNQYGSYMSYFGLDMTQDLSNQMYSETLTWKDFFEQMTVDNITQNKAIQAQAEAAGFTYDTTEDYKNFEESIKEAATEVGVSVKDYVRQVYGTYATLSRIEDFVKEDMMTTAYYAKLEEEKAPSDEEVQAFYESNKDGYESVDYRVTTIKAELPTEPTELADTTAEATENAATGTDAAATETAYQPSEAEIAKAMADAKVLADEALAKVTTEGQLMENVTKSTATATINEWLFDSSRKAGDTTVIEDTYNNQYYVLAFEKRYLDETPTKDIRIIWSEEKAAAEILDEWKSGAATEESFIELCSKYSMDSSVADGGLYEGLVKGGVPTEVEAWLFDETHAAGDTFAVTSEDGTSHYVVYYVGENEPAWKLSIRSTLLNQEMSAYLEEISASIALEDPKGNLNYLKVQAEEEAQ